MSRIVAGTDFLILQDLDVSYAAFDAYWTAGGRTFDTATVYGRNSNLFGDWVRAHGVARDVVFLDKGCHPAERPRVTREDIFADLRTNHERLGVDHTDLFVLHRDDPEVPIESILEWLNEAKSQGLFSSFGGSNWSCERIREANSAAERMGVQGFSLSNPNFALAYPREPIWAGCVSLTPACRKWHRDTGFPVFAWSSMARGYFAGAEDADVLRAFDSDENRARRDRARSLARAKGVSAPQIALAWVLSQPLETYALCGMRTADQVRQAVEALDLELTPEELSQLESGD